LGCCWRGIRGAAGAELRGGDVEVGSGGDAGGKLGVMLEGHQGVMLGGIRGDAGAELRGG